LAPEAYRQLRNTGHGRFRDFPLPDGRRVERQLVPFPVIREDAVFVTLDSRG